MGEAILSLPSAINGAATSQPRANEVPRPEGWQDVLAELRAIRRAIERHQSEAISAKDAAALLGIGESTFWRMHAAGKVPRPVKLAGSVRWRRRELLGWLQAGAPSRAEWEARRKA
jgi:predicted DNA-binding transcriptional regulator AlpA